MQLTESERERLYAALSAHAASGAIALDELERRIERVAAAQTREQAAAVLADLPRLRENGPPPGSAPARGRRGHGHADRPATDWQPTNERFRDTRTGRVMRVWEDGDGGRHYVPDA